MWIFWLALANRPVPYFLTAYLSLPLLAIGGGDLHINLALLYYVPLLPGGKDDTAQIFVFYGYDCFPGPMHDM